MNLSIKIFLIILSFACLIGCSEDLLETIPNDRVSSEIFWKTDKDAIFAANAVYTYLENAGSFAAWDGMTDIGHTNSVTSTNALIERGQFDSTFDRVLNEWTNAYAGIRAANSYLHNVQQVQTNNPDLIDRLVGEVKVLRAYLYIKLAVLYGDVPLITTDISLDESRELTRTPVEQVWNFISTELTEASQLLPAIQTEKGRITKGAALALKARAMLYSGNYIEAAIASKEVMDLEVYSLYPSYEKLFSYTAEDNEEVVLDKQFIKNIYSNNIFELIGPWSQQNSNSAFVPTKKLVDAYQMSNGKLIADPSSGFNPFEPYKNRDPRLKYSIFTVGDKLPDGSIYNSEPGSGTADAVDFSWFSTSTGYNIKKYINEEDYVQPGNSGINIILIRYAEVLLTFAEARIETNQINQEVMDAINTVRQRPDVGLPPIIGIHTQEELREIVRHERMVELAFEGLRYFDLRRWRIAEDVIPGNVYGMTYTENGTIQTVQVPAFSRVFNKNRDYLWPIPQKEIELNPNLKQNPNW